MSSYQDKLAELQNLNAQVSSMANWVDAKEKNLMQKESQLRQGQIPVQGGRDVQKNMSKNFGPFMAPGNLGDINKVIWPYFFTTDVPPESGVGPNETFQTGFSVTQEAAFVMMSYTKAVYLMDGTPKPIYLDPNDNTLVSQAPGLTFSLRDASSSRQFINRPIDMGVTGNPRFPAKFPRPIMLLPNQTMQIQFINSHPSNVYFPQITVFGYRIRIEDAQQFLSLVYG